MQLFTRLCLAGLMAIAHCPIALAQTDAAASIERLKTFRFGDDVAILDAVSRRINEARPHPDRRSAAARDLATVLNSDASFDAKQFACRELLLIAGEEQVPALAGLLQDERLAHYALMVLARIPGKAVDEALRRELPRSQNRTRVEIIEAIGQRRDVDAIPVLAAQLDAGDEVAAQSAAALGKMGDARAVQPLQQAYERADTKRRLIYGRALLECAERRRSANDSQRALSIYEQLQRPPAREELSAGVLRGVAQASSQKALPQILDALNQDGSPLQLMALALVRELPGRALTQSLSAHLPNLSAAGQLLLIEALIDRRDVAAVPAITALSRSVDSAVRTASVKALGTLGDASVVSHLLEIAASQQRPQKEAARTSLAQLRGQPVDAALLAMLDKAPTPVRVEIIDILGQRRVVAAVPKLVREIRSRQNGVGIATVRVAAVRVLREMGRPDDLPTLLEILPTASPNERVAVVSAITGIAQRGENENQRTQAILTQLSKTSTPAAKAQLLAILGQIGGDKVLLSLRKAVGEPAPEVRLSALRALADWPSDAPANDLLNLTRSTKDEKLRAIALRGYIRMIGLSQAYAPDRMVGLYREVTSLSTTPELKRLVLAGVAKHPSLAALEYASSFVADKEVRAEAEVAVVEIGRSTIGAWRDKTRLSLEPIAQSSANESARNGAREVLTRGEKFADFISAWEVSPAYEREGATSSQLFDMPFAPEEPKSANKVLWRLMPAGTNAEQPWLLDLLALWGGEQRVAYLRTRVWSESARDVVLESGSDDGTKAWWNGDVVLSENVQRAVAPGQNKVKLPMKAGWNQLMLKITQNNLGWGACARFTNVDGSPISGLRYSLPSSLNDRS